MNNLFFASNNCNRDNPHPSKDEKKVDFKKIKCNTFNSLNEVEFFLNNFNRFWKYVKLYKFFK